MLIKSKVKIENSTKEKDSLPYEKELLQEIKTLRRELASHADVPAYIVLSDATLLELATYLPQTKEEFSKISGFGEIKIEKYGKIFRDVVVAYCDDRELHSRIHLKQPKRAFRERTERDNDTKKETLQLYKEGHSVKKIAEIRKLSVTTIELHLAFYVQQGKLPVEEVMNPGKIMAIEVAVEKFGAKALSPVKDALGTDYSFSEIKYVIAHLESKQAEEEEVVYQVVKK